MFHKDKYFDQINAFRSILPSDYTTQYIVERYITGNLAYSGSTPPEGWVNGQSFPKQGICGSNVYISSDENVFITGAHTVVRFSSLPGSLLVNYDSIDLYPTARQWYNAGIEASTTEIITAGVVNTAGYPFYLGQITGNWYAGHWFVFPSGFQIASNEFSPYRLFPGLYNVITRTNVNPASGAIACNTWDGCYRFGRCTTPKSVDSVDAVVAVSGIVDNIRDNGIAWLDFDQDNTYYFNNHNNKVFFSGFVPTYSPNNFVNIQVQFEGLKLVPNQTLSTQAHLLIQQL